MKLFKLVTGTLIAGSLFTFEGPAKAEKYKVKLGGGSAYWGGHPSFAVVKVNNSNVVSIYHTTNTVDQLLGTGKWWDHPVIASRACIVSETGWEDTSECLMGERGEISLPENADPKVYTYEIKWKESGAIQHAKFGLR